MFTHARIFSVHFYRKETKLSLYIVEMRSIINHVFSILWCLQHRNLLIGRVNHLHMGFDASSVLLSAVVGVLVGLGFQLSSEPAAVDKRISRLCCSVLDDMLFCESLSHFPHVH